MTRLFAAMVPPEEVREHLAGALDRLPASREQGSSGLRWGEVGQWHVTLAFYGEVPEGAVPDLAANLGEAVGALAAPPLRLRGAGSFGGRNLWVGVASERPALLVALLRASAEAARAVGPALADELGRRDRRRGHLTLARVSGRARAGAQGALSALVRGLSVYEGPPWRPGEVVVFSSRLGAGRGGGPLHERLAGLPFAARGA